MVKLSMWHNTASLSSLCFLIETVDPWPVRVDGVGIPQPARVVVHRGVESRKQTGRCQLCDSFWRCGNRQRAITLAFFPPYPALTISGSRNSPLRLSLTVRCPATLPWHVPPWRRQPLTTQEVSTELMGMRDQRKIESGLLVYVFVFKFSWPTAKTKT